MPKCQVSSAGPVFVRPPFEIRQGDVTALYQYLEAMHLRIFGSETGDGDLDSVNVPSAHGAGGHGDLAQATANADATASTVAVAAADAPEITSTDAPETTSADAATQGVGYVQADVQSIATLANELKADYNTARTLINELKTDVNIARTLSNELKADMATLVTDLNAVVTRFNALQATLRTAALLDT